MAREHKSTYVLTAEDRTRQAFASLEASFKRTERTFNTLRNLTAGVFSIAGLTVFLQKNAEAERAANRLTAVINAQGHAAGFTRGQLDEMADSLAQATQFDDEDFRNAEATLLKFGNVYNDVFARALQASADLAAFNNTDLSSAVEAVGKALQNPAEGLKQFQSQLSRIDPAQRKFLESLVAQNRVVEAQNLLLDILQKNIGGAAQILNSGFSKALSDTGKNFDELLEALGKTDAVQGTVTGFFGFLNQSLRDMKSIIEAGDWFGGLLFLMGFRGHDVSAQSAMALEIQNVERNLRDQQAKAGQTTDPVHSRNVTELTEKLKKLNAEYERLYGLQGAKPAPKAKIDSGPLKGKGGGIVENNRNLLGIAGGFLAQQEEAQRFAAVELQKQIDLVQRANELTRAKAEGEAFGAEQLGIYRDAQLDATRAIETYITSIDNETRLMGTTTAGRARLLDIMRLEEEQRDLIAKGTALTVEEMDRLKAAINRARDAQDALNESWAFGAQNALSDYIEQVRNVSVVTESLVTNAFRGMEDALLEFVRTGKKNFTDLAESIISDLIRIQIRASITGPLAQFLSGVIPGVSAGGTTSVATPRYKAAGGPVSAGMPYWVGELGPELVVPRHAGTVIPNDRAFGGGNVTINQSITIDSRTDRAEVMAVMLQVKEITKAELRKENVRRPASR